MLSSSSEFSMPQKMINCTVTTMRTPDPKMNSAERHLYSFNSSKKNNIFCSSICFCHIEERL